MCKLSIIIPAYNAQDTIERCVRSALHSAVRDAELLIVNDGSTDRTAELTAALAREDSRVRLINQPNAGVSNARNRGLDEATGDIIMFLDSDDHYAPDMCETLLESMEQNDSDIALCGYIERAAGRSSVCLCPAPQTLEGSLDILERYIKPVVFSGANTFMGSVWNCAFKRSIIQNLRLRFDESLRFAEDTLFLTRYLLACKRMSVVNQALYNYELGDGSVTKRYSPYIKQNCLLYNAALEAALTDAGAEYTPDMRGASALSAVFAILVNEARAGNPNKISQKLKLAFHAGDGSRESIHRFKPSSTPARFKRVIAKSPLLCVCFYIIRRLQRAMGVYF